MSAQVDDASAAPTPDARPARPRRRARRVLLAVLALLLLVIAALAWLAYRGAGAVDALRDAQDALADVTAQDGALDGTESLAALEASLPALQDATARAEERTDDPVWRAAEHVPWLGDQLTAVRAVSLSLDEVAARALPATVQAGALLTGDGLRADDGRIDLAAVQDVAAPVADAAGVARTAHERVARLDRTDLVGLLDDAVGDVDDALTELAATLDGASDVTRLLPPLLGADGPRTYLVLALNSAELRTAGGIVGAVLELRVDDGRVSLVRQVAARDVAVADEPVLALSDAELAILGTPLGRYMQNASGSPDFPRTAAIATALWEADGGDPVDGVIATDPVTVRLVLRATGPLPGPGGKAIRGSTFLQKALRDVYLEVDDDAQADAYFAAVAATVLGAVGSGTGDAEELVRAAARSVDERRVRIWSAHPDEQAVLARSTIGGAFLSGGAPQAVGVFLDDATTAKLDYDLTSEVTVEELECSGPSPTATVRIDLAYDPPADVATWRDSVLGIRPHLLPRGWLDTRVTVYGPVGGQVGALAQDEGFVGVPLQEQGREVRTTAVVLAPGQETTLRVTVPVVDGVVDVWTTPTLGAPGAVLARCVAHS